MILATRLGNRELRANFGNADQIPIPGSYGSSWSSAGERVTTNIASGLPAVMAAIRLLAETVGSLPLIVYEGTADDKQRRPDAPQWSLLHDQPNSQQTPSEVWSYAMACTQGWGGAFLLKGTSLLRGSRTVMSLTPMDPQRVEPVVKNSELVFVVRAETGGKAETLTKRDLLYIPGMLTSHPLIGVSPIAVHREAIGGALALEKYGNRFYGNDATPGLIIKTDPTTGNTKPQRDDAKEAWDNRHRGSGQAHGTAVLPPGWSVERIGVSPSDAQFIEGQKWTVDQVARIFKINPAAMIGGTDNHPRATPEERNQDFLQYSLMGHLVRFEQRLHADDDLFPDKTLRPQFLADALLRASMSARYAAYLQGRQAGWLSVNDIRRKEGEPDIGPKGDEYQATPVGGAPNLQPPAGDDTTVEPAEPAA